MYALLSVLIVLSLSLLIVRVGTVALTMTGLSEDVASLQSLSAFTGAGFTTEEAEQVVNYPSRRTVIKHLVRLGNVGLITGIASLVLSFVDPVGRLSTLLTLIAATAAITLLARSRWLNELVTPVIRWALERRSEAFAPRDYTGLLKLDRDYSVADLEIREGEWPADERIGDLQLRSEEGVVVLGIRREDGTYIGAPGGEHEIRAGDTIIAYGQTDRLRELAERGEDDDEARESAKRAHTELLNREEAMDPARRSVVPGRE